MNGMVPRARYAVPLVLLMVIAQPAPAAGAMVTTAVVNTGGGPLNVRSGPSTVDARVGSVNHGTRLAVVCQAWGQQVSGAAGRSALWNRISSGGYVSDAYVTWRPSRPNVPWCSPPPTAASYGRVKLPSGAMNIRSGPGLRFSVVGKQGAGTVIYSTCQVWGEPISGPAAVSSVWHRLAAGRYVSDAYIAWSPSRPRLPFCGQDAVSIPPGSVESFIAWAAGPARESRRVYRVPASVTIAQGIMESGVGRSWLNRFDHNYFGMKCFGWPGPIALGCRSYATTECGKTGCYRTYANFRAYRNAYASFVDHGRQLATLARYKTAMAFVHDPNRFAIEIHKAGYATSPSYSTNLINVMRTYNLYRFDR
jgi:flagellar protein FlgJ